MYWFGTVLCVTASFCVFLLLLLLVSLSVNTVFFNEDIYYNSRDVDIRSNKSKNKSLINQYGSKAFLF